ncbi:MAG: X2-like carbohydrate binding domain-containing protein [Ruminococcus sp.]
MVMSLVPTIAYASEVGIEIGDGAPVKVTTLDNSVDTSSICVSLNTIFRNKETGEEELLEDIDRITPENVTVATFETVKASAIEDAKTKLNEWLEITREVNPDVQFTVVGDMVVEGDDVAFDNRVYTMHGGELVFDDMDAEGNDTDFDNRIYTMRSGETVSGTTSRYMEITGDYGKTGSYSVTMTVEVQAVGDIPSYSIIEGENGVWIQNSDETLAFRANGDLSKFTGVKVDDTLIDAKNYTAVSGSTVITLKTYYLNTLSVGTHKLTVVYNDGECSTNFEVKKAATEQTEPTDTPKPDDTQKPTNPTDTSKPADSKSPKTGDNSNLALWFALLFVSGAVTVGTTVYSRKKNHSAK